MKGKYEIKVKDARLQYKFTISRNITILRGDSATGKTTLIDMISAYQQNHMSSGVTISCEKECVVLNSYNWQMNLSQMNDKIVFIDEGASFVKTSEFSEMIKSSNNYYVIATRSFLPNLPYSITEVYGIKNTSGNKYQNTKRLYSRFYPLYKKQEISNKEKMDIVITEDSNSGYEFFHHICGKVNMKCVSANGKSNIVSLIQEYEGNNIMIIADGAAFGPEIETVLTLAKRNQNISMFFPESFEWLILHSGLIKNVEDILENPSDFIESEEYFSWERFFTALLCERTKGSYLEYKKSKLNEFYLHDDAIESILESDSDLKKVFKS